LPTGRPLWSRSGHQARTIAPGGRPPRHRKPGAPWDRPITTPGSTHITRLRTRLAGRMPGLDTRRWIRQSGATRECGPGGVHLLTSRQCPCRPAVGVPRQTGQHRCQPTAAGTSTYAWHPIWAVGRWQGVNRDAAGTGPSERPPSALRAPGGGMTSGRLLTAAGLLAAGGFGTLASGSGIPRARVEVDARD